MNVPENNVTTKVIVVPQNRSWILKGRPLLDGGKGKKNTPTRDTPFAPFAPHTTAIAPTRAEMPTPALPHAGDTRVRWALPIIGAAFPTKREPRATTPPLGILRQAPVPVLSHTSTEGLEPPALDSTDAVTGASTPQHRIENKRKRRNLQAAQPPQCWWTRYQGASTLPAPLPQPPTQRNNMCPSGLALHHLASPILLKYAQKGCPVETGKPWSKQQILAAIARGPHISALVPEASAQLDREVNKKCAKGQARLVKWSDIHHNIPQQLKISPIAMVPHKSRPYQAILDLSFSVKLDPQTSIPSVNSTTTKIAPKGAIDQLGHALPRIIHAFATADPSAKNFMAKWDIKDGFWRLDCQAGEEWNFAYVLPSSVGTNDPVLVIPTSLQMGWIESPSYFCTASETARDVAAYYADLPIGSLPRHKFTSYTTSHDDFKSLPLRASGPPGGSLRHVQEAFMDDFIDLAIASSQQELTHISTATMTGIHDVFPADTVSEDDPISLRKLLKGEAAWANVKEILGMTFDGREHTIWLAADKQDAIIHTLTTWLRGSSTKKGIPFADFQSTISKLHHAFITIPAGKGLLSPFYTVLVAKAPATVFVSRNDTLKNAIADCHTFLRETISRPTYCKNLITGWPDYVGITDASAHGVGGVIIGENKEVPPIVFRAQWPTCISTNIISNDNPNGTITNSDLELAGLLILWLVMEDICEITNAHVALFSDNSPTVHWVQRLAAKHSPVAMQLICALGLCLQLAHALPLTPLHIAGIDNALTDIPSRSFGSEAKWHCADDNDLLTLFNATFPLPNQASWTVFRLSSAIVTRVTSSLQMKVFTGDDWRKLPPKGRLVGNVGPPTSSLWDWTLTFKKHCTPSKYAHSRVSQHVFEPDLMGAENKLALERSLALSWPLA